MASLLYGLKITFRHFLEARKMRTPIGVSDKEYFTQKDGIVTLQYPKEEFPVPDIGRYQLHNEIDDCIVCDKCAKVCPVNCIDIEPVRAVEEIGVTSDGTPKRIYAAKFDIDMSKCCFCGLCTVVCPTECLTMTKEYDFSVFDLKEHNFVFGDMSPELIAEKKTEFEVYQAEKEKLKVESGKLKVESGKLEVGSEKSEVGSEKLGSNIENETEKPKATKPVFRPKVKPKLAGSQESEVGSGKLEVGSQELEVGGGKPEVESEKRPADNDQPTAKSVKPVFRPKIKPKNKE